LTQASLPIWDKVIFVDWHGLLSRDPFWISILNNPRHPLHGQLSEAVKQLFSQNDLLVRDWMRGSVPAGEVIDSMQIKLGKQYKPDYLLRKLFEDCQRMRTNRRLLQILQAAQNNGTWIVLATDNMDCFDQTIRRFQGNRRKPVSADADETQSITETACFFDDLLCSSERGILKSEDALRFYGDWLSNHGLDFRNALLLDDLEKNCRAFCSVGGSALRLEIDTLEKKSATVAASIRSWLQAKS
jgi:hypothetical protein